MTLYHLCCLGLFVLLYSGSCSAASTEDENEADWSHKRVRRSGWSMFRLGRGLQMLRLGKRGLPMMRMGRAPVDEYTLAPEELRFLLASVSDDFKSLSSRQVPVPRYGKDLDYQTAYEKSLEDEENEKLMSRSGAMVDEELPHLRTSSHGGRFRRSNLSRFAKLSERLRQMQKHKQRAVALPRIGRFSKDRAVPIPRIG